MDKPKVAAQPDYWPEDDARTLQRSHEIRCDSKRHKAARKHLNKFAAAAQKEDLEAKVGRGLKRAFTPTERE